MERLMDALCDAADALLGLLVAVGIAVGLGYLVASSIVSRAAEAGYVASAADPEAQMAAIIDKALEDAAKRDEQEMAAEVKLWRPVSKEMGKVADANDPAAFARWLDGYCDTNTDTCN